MILRCYEPLLRVRAEGLWAGRALHSSSGPPVRRCMRSHDLAIDRPDEGRQLAGDRRGDDVRPLALPGERPKAPAQPHLRFPGNLAHRPRFGRPLYLLLTANTWRIPIAPSGFDQDTPRRPLPLVIPPRLTVSPVELS